MASKFVLEWFYANNNDLAGEKKIYIARDELWEMFWIQENDPIDGVPVRASQRSKLQVFIAHRIDLNQYDYSISEYVVDETNEWAKEGF